VYGAVPPLAVEENVGEKAIFPDVGATEAEQVSPTQSEFVVHELAGAGGVVTVCITHCWLVLQAWYVQLPVPVIVRVLGVSQLLLSV
jgi:hypothetical protein